MRVVALGFSCNNACVYCAQGELRATTAPAPSAVDALVDAIAPGERVAFVGGEPTLDPALPARIRAAHARGAASIILQTNGRRLAYRAYARELAASSSRLSLDVSLAGSTEAMHDYHTATPGSFKQTLRGLQSARAEGMRAAVTVVVTRSSFRHLVDVVRLAHGVGARAVQLSIAAPYGSAARAADRVVPSPELVRPHLALAVEEARRFGLGVVVGDRAAPAEAVAWFAGLGEVEHVPLPAPRVAPTIPGGTRVALALLGRPAPGRNEVHAQERRTGAALEEIFPGLFGGVEAIGEGEPAGRAASGGRR
jgi:MoaA/NifB/PqqE/SkfB family radical SAM enzyme